MIKFWGQKSSISFDSIPNCEVCKWMSKNINMHCNA